MSSGIDFYRDITGKVVAIVIKADHSEAGIDFITTNEELMQVAYMGHPANYEITPHYHNRIPRQVDYTSEALIIRKGTMRVDLFYEQQLTDSFLVKKGDVLVLLGGGHGFKMIDDVEMIEIKQGPFMGPSDKTRF